MVPEGYCGFVFGSIEKYRGFVSRIVVWYRKHHVFVPPGQFGGTRKIMWFCVQVHSVVPERYCLCMMRAIVWYQKDTVCV